MKEEVKEKVGFAGVGGARSRPFLIRCAPPAVRWATEAAAGGAGSRSFLIGVPPQPLGGLQRRPWAALGVKDSSWGCLPSRQVGYRRGRERKANVKKKAQGIGFEGETEGECRARRRKLRRK